MTKEEKQKLFDEEIRYQRRMAELRRESAKRQLLGVVIAIVLAVFYYIFEVRK